MRHFFWLTVVLFVLQVSASGNAYSFDRSGDITINEKIAARVQTSWPMSDIEVKDVQVYNVLARVLGLPRSSQVADISNPPVPDVFARPRRVLLFTIDGASATLPANDYKILGKKGAVITPSTSAATPFSLVASSLTGVLTSEHGVVHKGWPSLDLASDNFYMAANIYDRILQTQMLNNGKENFGGFLSGSSSQIAVRLISPHARSLSGLVQAGQSYFWNHQDGKYDTVFSQQQFEPKLAIRKADFPALLQQLETLLGIQVHYNSKEASLKVMLKGDPVPFDLAQEVDETFVAELLFVLNAVNLIAKRTIPPTLFSFHFESPKAISDKYGFASRQYETVLLLLDAIINHAKQSFDEMAIFYLDAAHSPAGKHAVQTHAQLDEFYPHVYVNDKTMDLVTLCETLKVTLSSDQVICHKVAAMQKRGIEQSPQPAPAPTPTPPPAPPAPNPAVGELHVVLWVVVTLFAIIGAAIFCMCDVSDYAAADSTLYGSTRMVFEKPRGRPHHKGQ